jgi:hypothetical protein
MAFISQFLHRMAYYMFFFVLNRHVRGHGVWGGGQDFGRRRELDVLWSDFSLIFLVLLVICSLLDSR